MGRKGKTVWVDGKPYTGEEAKKVEAMEKSIYIRKKGIQDFEDYMNNSSRNRDMRSKKAYPDEDDFYGDNGPFKKYNSSFKFGVDFTGVINGVNVTEPGIALELDPVESGDLIENKGEK